MTKKRVLIVEDQGITAMDEQEIMSELGYKVTGIVMTGEDAVQRAGRDRPDVVLMDIMLAGKMDGREAALKIRELYKIPVVYVTAYGDKKAAKAGQFTVPEGFGYIVKPYTKEELASEIERLMG
jgi:CheY-like chemotaxis protein